MIDENDKIRLKVCSALLTRNRPQLEWATTLDTQMLGEELAQQVTEVLKVAPEPGKHWLVKATMFLPAWVQYLGQRAILFFPKISSRLLLASGLHHQMY